MRKQETTWLKNCDVIAIESTQHQWHISCPCGIISLLDGVGPDQLNIESLINRVQKKERKRSFLH
jgi:recombinational DNA repair protein RecR